MPTSKVEIRTCEENFYNKCNENGDKSRMRCFAILDGKHWETEHPPHSGSLNMNYKSYFSFNSLAMCDSDLRVIYLQISKHGVNSDAQMFRDGPLGDILSEIADIGGFRTLPDSNVLMPPFILSDNGFALTKNVMQPYRELQLTPENMAFNEKLCATRVKIENFFGVFTSKFRIFRRALNLDPANSRALVVALCVVHNIQVGRVVLTASPNEAVFPDPYSSAECQRTALKKYILNL
uniref:DDE Tnp4 domain-containing protein n=1 Tax=Caenorhabditis japonica TaxID=281687 RepID=A0A2Q4SNE7_CAEJA